MHVHILGICGTLMGSIALLAREQGHTVTGSDENVYPPMSDQLSNAGIELSTGNTPENIPASTDIVMIGNAGLPRGHPAVEYVLDKGLNYTSGAEWLGRYLLHDKWVIAVAGTHGKTTTTSMVAWILEFAGMAPGYLIGGVPGNFEQSARLGDTPFFVIEADEYDTSYFDRRSKFLHYHPRTVILNNLEFDHADIFASLEDIENQFHLLLRTVPGSGLVLRPALDENLDRVIGRGCWTPVQTFSTLDETEAGITASLARPDGTEFVVSVAGETVGQVTWKQTGDHNVANALAAIGAARHVGVKPGIACQALCQFAGVKRRMEPILERPNLTVYDDFAHHPTAIRTTLEGLRKQVGSERIVVALEPRSHTMKLGTHAETLRAATRSADRVIWFRPTDIRWDMQALAGDASLVVDNTDAVLEALSGETGESPTHIVIMSNGDFGGVRKAIVERLG